MGWASARPIAVHSLRRRLKRWKRKTIWKWSSLWWEVPLCSSRPASHGYSSSGSLSDGHPYFTSVIQAFFQKMCSSHVMCEGNIKLILSWQNVVVVNLFYFIFPLVSSGSVGGRQQPGESPIGQCNPTVSLGWVSHSPFLWLLIRTQCGKWGTGD